MPDGARPASQRMLETMSDQTTHGANRAPLRRDRRSKVIAGVCGGLGRHLDIDPVVFRILFAVLTFVGGIGLLAYAAAWLFVPVEGTHQSEAHRLLTGSNPLSAVVVTIGLALGALATISALTNGLEAMWPLWMIGAAIAGVLIWRGDLRLGRGERGRGAEQPPTWWQQPVGEGGAAAPQDAAPSEYTAEYAATSRPAAATAGVGGVGGGGVGEFVSAGGVGGGDGIGGGLGMPGAVGEARAAGPWVDLSRLGDGDGAETGGAFGAPPGPGEPVRQRPRGFGGLVLASLLAATGVVGVLDAAGLINLTWLSGGALILLMLGGGMVVGGMFGKTTWLVPIGIVLAVPLILLAAVDVPLHGNVGDVNWTPASAAKVRGTYELGLGEGRLDLTKAAPGAGKTLTVHAHVGIGDLRVQVPSDVAITVHEHAGIGDVQRDTPGVDGTVTGGVGRTMNFTLPAHGKSQGTLVLDLNTGIGDVNVEQN